MVKAVDFEKSLKEFKIGVNKSKSGKIGNRNITISQASRAVGGNFFRKTYERFKLFFGVGQRKEFFRNKSIESRLNRLDSKSLHEINRLFNFCYPKEDQVKDKRIVTLMNQFVRPKIQEESTKFFFQGIDAATYQEPKDKQSLSHLVKLAEANIDLQALKDKGLVKEDHNLDFLKDSAAIDQIFEKFGLTAEYKKQLIDFSTSSTLPMLLFRRFSDQEADIKENLMLLLSSSGNEESFAQSILPHVKPENTASMVINNLKDRDWIESFLVDHPPELKMDESKKLELIKKFTSDENFQKDLQETMSKQELINALTLAQAGLTAKDYANYIDPDRKNFNELAKSHLEFTEDIQACIELFQLRQQADKMSGSMFSALDPASQTEENRKSLYGFFDCEPLLTEAEQKAFEDAKSPEFVKNILEVWKNNEDFENPFHYNRLKEYLGDDRDPIEAIKNDANAIRRNQGD